MAEERIHIRMFTNMYTKLHSSAECQAPPRNVDACCSDQEETVGIGDKGPCVAQEKQTNQDSKVRAPGAVGVGKGRLSNRRGEEL
jgi:hypothetical protein